MRDTQELVLLATDTFIDINYCRCQMHFKILRQVRKLLQFIAYLYCDLVAGWAE
jgi:hypothetical protein